MDRLTTDTMTADTKLRVALLLQRAAYQLRTRGWIRNAYQNDAGACCTTGALISAEHAYDMQLTDRMMAQNLIKSVIGTQDTVPSIAWWNDNVARNAAEVIKVLDRAAERALES